VTSAATAERSVTKVKLNGPARTWTSRLVDGTDDHAWLYAPAGTLVHHESPPGHVTRYESAGVQLLVPGLWWTGWWWAAGHRIDIDITLPVSKVDGGYRYTDLKLDLWWQDSDCGIVDQDDLQAALDIGDLDSATAARAAAMADDLQTRLERDHEFVQSGFNILARILGVGGLLQ
jgi:hypothetical protein